MAITKTPLLDSTGLSRLWSYINIKLGNKVENDRFYELVGDTPVIDQIKNAIGSDVLKAITFDEIDVICGSTVSMGDKTFIPLQDSITKTYYKLGMYNGQLISYTIENTPDEPDLSEI